MGNPNVWVVVLALAGYVALGAQQWLADQRAAGREERARIAEREQRRADFQRETLLALQDALAKLMRAAGAINHRDRVHHREAGTPFGTQQLPGEWDDKAHASTVEIRKIVERVEDEELRGLVNEIRDATTSVFIPQSEEGSTNALLRAGDLYDQASERLGPLLRSSF